MTDVREEILASTAPVRLVTGGPGVGKTYFGCELAERHLMSVDTANRQKVLFLTFARNAVARIRQAYDQRILNDGGSGHTRRQRAEWLRDRIRLDTFAGFFWWVVENYGRYARGGSNLRPWLVGTHRVDGEMIPAGYEPYTFDVLEETALAVLRIAAVRGLVSAIYPLVIVDEHQDVHPRLQEIIALLGQGSRLVLLRGPSQCIYRGLKGFDPDAVLESVRNTLAPQEFMLTALGGDKQRYSKAVETLIRAYDAGSIRWDGANTRRTLVPRKNTKGFPNHLETHVAMAARDVRQRLRASGVAEPSIAVLASTNSGVAAIHHRLRAGNPTYYLRPMRASLVFEDVLLLNYGRLLLELLASHWIARQPRTGDPTRIAIRLASLFCHMHCDLPPSQWIPLAGKLCDMVKAQRPRRSDPDVLGKLRDDVAKVNDWLRATKSKLPSGCPATPFTKADGPLLQLLTDEFVGSFQSMLIGTTLLDVNAAWRTFEGSMQVRAYREKLGVSQKVQVMTIHKAKGREFDGVVVVLEDSPKALWREGGKSSDIEVSDLYRVAISRARNVVAMVAFADAKEMARLPLRPMLQ